METVILENLLSVKEVADRLGIHNTAVYDAMRSGRLPFVEVLGKKGVREADLAAYIPRQYRDRPGAKAKGGRPRKTGE